MKTFIQIIFKCFLFILILCGLIMSLSINTLNEMKVDFLTVLMIDTWSNDMMVQGGKEEEVELERPLRIYLYNTHQSEEYIDGVSIYEVTDLFAQMLRTEGFEVVFETADFLDELHKQKMKYNQLYSISKIYLEDALVNDGPFDLIIDVHRDSASRQVSVLQKDGIEYARLMFVVGETSMNSASVRAMSNALSDKMNQRFSGIMREPFTRYSQYNQGVAENMLLLEVGSDTNTSSEAIRSLRIFVEMLKEEGWS